jgi:pyruvate dehydrogenase E2 component (dihydrolipoamide acetyltransferase)
VEATAGGVLAEIRAAVGETVPVGTVVAVIGGVDASVSPPAQTPQRAPSPPPAPKRPALVVAGGTSVAPRPTAAVALDPFFEVRTPERNYGPARRGSVTITPLARRLAVETGVDLASVQGSGQNGRIFARDLRGSAPRAATGEGLRPDQVRALYEAGSYEEVPLDTMRTTIAARLVQAKQTIPHFYLTADIGIDAMLKLREDANAAAPKGKDGAPAYRLSVTDIVIKAWAAALQRVPAANAVWAGTSILRLTHSDIGVAVAIDGGLYTPIIRQAETKSLSSISGEMKALAARARARRLKPQEYQGGSSAISNLGMHGIRAFSAIINPPHATILAVGAARRQAVEQPGGGIAFVGQMTVTLSCDHRVVDGALGAELLAAFRGLIENPATALA